MSECGSTYWSLAPDSGPAGNSFKIVDPFYHAENGRTLAWWDAGESSALFIYEKSGGTFTVPLDAQPGPYAVGYDWFELSKLPTTPPDGDGRCQVFTVTALSVQADAYSPALMAGDQSPSSPSEVRAATLPATGPGLAVILLGPIALGLGLRLSRP